MAGIAGDEPATIERVPEHRHTVAFDQNGHPAAPERGSLLPLALGVAPLPTPVAVPPVVALPSVPLDSWTGLDLIIGAPAAARGRARPPQDCMHG